jgi:tRNA(Arg) A34 adenosine deaminase TadA
LTVVVTDPSAAWTALPAGAGRALELAHRSLIAGGLAVGAAILDHAGTVVADGRNRAYDAATRTDPLERTPVAHAEMNAMARLDTDADTSRMTLWSTHQPCTMCRGAIEFIGIPDVLTIATDPSSPNDGAHEVLDDVWVVLATTMFLIGPFRRGGRDHPIIQANLTREPESIALTQLVAAGPHPLVDSNELPEAVTASWGQLSSAAERRQRRRADAR